GWSPEMLSRRHGSRKVVNFNEAISVYGNGPNFIWLDGHVSFISAADIITGGGKSDNTWYHRIDK
ncbi:MAG: hypothetical protein WCP55_25290, partial [Lentisphaerota bacterium]